MRLTHLVATAAALSMVALPVLAAPRAANPAAKLSLADNSAPVQSVGSAKKANAMSTPVVVGVAAVAVVAGALALGKRDSKAASS
jgi:hypothetical protein